MSCNYKMLAVLALTVLFSGLCHAGTVTNLQTLKEYSDLQKAIDEASSGHTLSLSAGEFNGAEIYFPFLGEQVFQGYTPFEIDSKTNLTLIGVGKSTVINMLRVNNSDNITLESTRITGDYSYAFDEPYAAHPSIQIEGSDGIVLHDNTITSGIKIDSGKDHLFSRNIINGGHHNNIDADVEDIEVYHNYFGNYVPFGGTDSGDLVTRGGMRINASDPSKLIVKNNLFTVPLPNPIFPPNPTICEVEINLAPGSTNYHSNIVAYAESGLTGGVVEGWSKAEEEQNNSFAFDPQLNSNFYPISPISPVIDEGTVLSGVPSFVTDAVSDGSPDVGPKEFAGDLFVRAEGNILSQGGNPVRFESIAFTNAYWDETSPFTNDFTQLKHHREQDFKKVKDLGFNSIRFALNADWFANNVQDNSNKIWTWMDEAMDFAEKYGILMIIDMHQPPGETWLSDDSAKSHQADSNVWFWNDAAKRNKLINLWRAIAERYKDNPIVAAYGILNEPITSDDDGEEWFDLANDLINTIRAVDNNHLILVDEIRGHAVTRTFEDPKTGNTVTRKILAYTLENVSNPKRVLADNNLVYDFHFYEPGAFTHKGASWGGGIDDGSVYPDTLSVLVDPTATDFWDNNWSAGVGLDGSNPSGTTWRKHSSKALKINDSDVVMVLAQIAVSGKLGTAKVFVDDLVIEKQKDGSTTWEKVRPLDVTENSASAFFPIVWGGTNADNTHDLANSFETSSTQGWNDNTSLILTNNESPNIAYGHSRAQIAAEFGASYRLSVRLRVEGNIPASATVNPSISLYTDINNQTFSIDKSYLKQAMKHWKDFSDTHDVPISCFEFASIINTYETPDAVSSGGEQWLTDVISILNDYNFSWSLWAYRNLPMGLFHNDSPTQFLDFNATNDNQPILDTLKSIMGAPLDGLQTWQLGIEYKADTYVAYQGAVYQSLITHIDYVGTPPTLPSLWKKVTPSDAGNTWALGESYAIGDIVSHKGDQYSCRQSHTAYSPYWAPDLAPALWQKL